MNNHIKRYYETGRFFGVPDERLKVYLDKAQGNPRLATLSLFLCEKSNRRSEKPMTSRQQKEYAKHVRSLDASEELAKKARILAMEKNWEYKQAVQYIQETEPELVKLATFGEAEDSDTRQYSENGFVMTYAEADSLLAAAIQKRMERGETHAEAREAVFTDPDLAPVVEAYVNGA